MMKFLQRFVLSSVAVLTCAVAAHAQSGCVTFNAPSEYTNYPNTASVWRVAAGYNASGAPVTTTTITTDAAAATTITQTNGVALPSSGLVSFCAPPGPYTVQFFNASGGSGYFNLNFLMPADSTAINATVTKIVDPTDPTKVIAFTVSGNTTGKTSTIAAASANSRTYTLPDPGGNVTFMFTNAATSQNLLTNAFTINDNTDATKKIAWSASGNTTAVTETVASAANIAATVTLPNATSAIPGTLGTYQGVASVSITDTNFHALIAAASDVVIPANTLNAAGKRIRVHGSGVYTNGAASLLNARVDLCTISGCATGTDFAAAGCAVVTTNQANNDTNAQFSIDCTFTTSSTLGASGTAMAKAVVCAQLTATTAGVQSCFQDTATAVSATFDETVNEFVNISFKFSSSNASDAAVLHEMSVELLK